MHVTTSIAIAPHGCAHTHVSCGSRVFIVQVTTDRRATTTQRQKRSISVIGSAVSRLRCWCSTLNATDARVHASKVDPEVWVGDAVITAAERVAIVCSPQIARNGRALQVVRFEETTYKGPRVAVECRDTQSTLHISCIATALDEASATAFASEDGVVSSGDVAVRLQLTW